MVSTIIPDMFVPKNGPTILLCMEFASSIVSSYLPLGFIL